MSSAEKPLILLITNAFPFGKGEEFLESEMQIAGPRNDIIIVSCNDQDALTRNVGDISGIVRIEKKTGLIRALFILARMLARQSFYLELIELLIGGRFSFGRFRACMGYLLQAEKIYRLLRNIIRESENRSIVLYSYWFNPGTLASVYCKQKYPNVVKTVCRAHGYDVYPERNKRKYLPFQGYASKYLDEIHFISNDGMRSYERRMSGKPTPSLYVSRLGTINHNVILNSNQDPVSFHVVSCSYVSPVKRVALLCDALSRIDGIPISWTHIGGGAALFDQLVAEAKEKLGSKENIRYEFLGNRRNHEILEYYRDVPIDLFVNVSESEGVPVSIMEAMSFGIPVLATDVGGVSEIVDDSNGKLVPGRITKDELASSIMDMVSMKKDRLLVLRKGAREKWETMYNAEKNYLEFYAQLSNLAK